MQSWLTRLISGWIPIGDKPFPEWLGKVLWVVGIYVACTLAMNYFFPAKSNVTTVAAGGTQIIQQSEPRDTFGVGCNMMRLYIKAGMKSK